MVGIVWRRSVGHREERGSGWMIEMLNTGVARHCIRHCMRIGVRLCMRMGVRLYMRIGMGLCMRMGLCTRIGVRTSFKRRMRVRHSMSIGARTRF